MADLVRPTSRPQLSNPCMEIKRGYMPAFNFGKTILFL